jgi:hypothetical protein
MIMLKENNEIHVITNKTSGIAKKILTLVEVRNINTGRNVQTSGLWDTGATGSVITKSTASALGLVPIGIRKVRGVHGIREVNEYFVNITLNNKNITVNVSVTECDELTTDNSTGLLIGMNIITLGDFAITNFKGNTTMSFRVPSMQNIDFLQE